MFDMDKAQAEATRRKLYDMLAAEKMMVQGYHFRSRRSPTSRRAAPATGWFRCRGTRRSEIIVT